MPLQERMPAQGLWGVVPGVVAGALVHAQEDQAREEGGPDHPSLPSSTRSWTPRQRHHQTVVRAHDLASACLQQPSTTSAMMKMMMMVMTRKA